ncbi:metal transporter [Halobacteriales archaeon SW_5_70_135]|nr:MAG: metal transporter [Halobacteriales archaeon SW_5_70_135]
MDDLRRRTVYYVVTVGVVMTVYAAIYQYGMNTFEDLEEPVAYLDALQFVVETFTATGYGADSAVWSTPEMWVMVILMDVTGVATLFVALPVIGAPLLRNLLSTSPPVAVEDRSDHVVVCTYSARGESLVEELDSRGVGYVVVEPDRERAAELYEDGLDVIHARPDTVAGLRAAGLPAARALVADATDEVDASIVLTAREVAEDARLVSVVEDPDRATYHELAGADEVLSPRPLLGTTLAQKVTVGVDVDAGAGADGGLSGGDFEVAEMPVDRDSDLVGRTLAESRLRERAGVNVIGGWFDGTFMSPPDPGTRIDEGTVLLVAGRGNQLERLRSLVTTAVREPGAGRTVVVGTGEVGRVVVDRLDEAGVEHTAVDVHPSDAVDVVGDATEPAALREAGVPEASSVVLALPDDTATKFATLVARDMALDAMIAARAEQRESVRKVYRAGADYVLSLGSIAGRMIAAAVLEEETLVSTDTQVSVVEMPTPGLAGSTLVGADVRARTGCTVVAVERDGEAITDVGADFRVEPGDDLVVAGTDADLNRFREQFG